MASSSAPPPPRGDERDELELLEPASRYTRTLLRGLRGALLDGLLAHRLAHPHAAACALVCDGSLAVGRVDPRNAARVVALGTARELLEGYDELLAALEEQPPPGYLRVLCAVLGDCTVLTMATGALPVALSRGGLA